jgi:hypothetical protein
VAVVHVPQRFRRSAAMLRFTTIPTSRSPRGEQTGEQDKTDKQGRPDQLGPIESQPSLPPVLPAFALGTRNAI